MFDRPEERDHGPSVAEVEAFLQALALPSPEHDDVGRIDRIAVMERVKGALSAAQARETTVFRASQLRVAVEGGASRRERSEVRRSVAAQVALARRESPTRGGRFVGLADALVREMPHAMAALTAGVISEWKATVLTRETACLSVEQRGEVDRVLAGSLPRLSDGELCALARRHAYRLDPGQFVARRTVAEAERRVSLRPAPEAMAALTAVLPLTQGVACLAALREAAAAARAAGDPRTRGQVMADTLVERLTGQSCAGATPVEVDLVMSDAALFGLSDEPAHVIGWGPVPAQVARDLLAQLPDETRAWIRRLYTDPVTGRLDALDTTRRCFDGVLRRAVVLRDDTCRTPYCSAPIRHVDHVVDDRHGGPTSARNGQGLCESCNYVKALPGWRARPSPYGGAGHSVEITTPTGHTYTSIPPPLPGARSPGPPRLLEVHHISLAVEHQEWRHAA